MQITKFYPSICLWMGRLDEDCVFGFATSKGIKTKIPEWYNVDTISVIKLTVLLLWIPVNLSSWRNCRTGGGGGVEGNPCLYFSSQPQLSTKTNLNRIGRTWALILSWRKEAENVKLKRFRSFFSIALGKKQGSVWSRRGKIYHLEIKLCLSLSAQFTHGWSAQRNFKMFAFVVDRVLGLSFVVRSPELSVTMSLG